MKLRSLLLLITLGLARAYGLGPPAVDKPLGDRLNLATHVIVGTVKSVVRGPTDGEKFGHYVSILTLSVDDALFPSKWDAGTEIQVEAVGPADDFRKEVGHGQCIYLLVRETRRGPNVFRASYGWNLREPMDALGEIKARLASRQK